MHISDNIYTVHATTISHAEVKFSVLFLYWALVRDVGWTLAQSCEYYITIAVVNEFKSEAA